MTNRFTSTIKHLTRNIPSGKVCTYGLIAAAAGNPQAARQVTRILHACAKQDRLPWYRVVNRHGKISLEPGSGYEIQKQLLRAEGIVFGEDETICFDSFLWIPKLGNN